MKKPIKEAALATVGAGLVCWAAPAASHEVKPAPVRVAIVQAASSMDDVLARTGREAHYLVFAAANDLRILIESFRVEARGGLDGPPSRLPPPQRKLFQDIEQAVADLRKAAAEPPGQAAATLKELPPLAQDAIPAGAQLLGAGPSVLAPSSTEAVQLTIRGVGLDRARPRLFLSNVEADRIHLSSMEAVFSIPVRALGFGETAPIVRSGSVMLSTGRCTLLIFCRNVERDYPLALLLLPARLAMVQVHFNRKVRQRVYDKAATQGGAAAAPDKVYSRTFEYKNNDLTLMSCTTDAQGPHGSGHLIDTSSLTLKLKSSAGSTRSRIATSSPTGFTVELCAQAQIGHLVKTSGDIAVVATWKEYQMEDVVLPPQSLPPQPLLWSTPTVVSLPPGTSQIAVEVDYFDGARATYTGDATDELINVRWDQAQQQLRLAARDTSDIAGIN